MFVLSMIVYGIATLKHMGEPGAARYNRNLTETEKKRYGGILKRLSSGITPDSPEEKKIYGIFAEESLTDLLKDAHLNIRVQLGQMDRFRDGLIRSGAYISEIMEILRDYNLPEDLAYLPHVESSFNYQAYSRFGAAGIWQFTRDTGRRYMRIDYTIDERRDPILSTNAAARFLKEAYDLLGSWPLAITAYNHGIKGMLTAKDKNENYENIYHNYDGRTFGFASKNFYSEFLAAREIARNYRIYFGELKLESPVERLTVEAPGYFSIIELSKHLGIPLDAVKELNPALREPVYSDQKYVPEGCRIYLPPVSPSYSLSASVEIPPGLIKESQKPSLFYSVVRGDTAQKIAREQGVTLNDLILANGLNSRATIYAGQNLRIPVPGEKIAMLSESGGSGAVDKPFPESSKNSSPDKIISTNAEVEIETQTAELPSKTRERIRDTGSILSMESLKAKSDVSQINPSVVTGDFSVSNVKTLKGTPVGIITVEPEETLGHYAEWLHTGTRRIRSLNGFSNRRAIHIGQKIRIPLDNVTAEKFEEDRFEYHKETEEDFFTAYRVEKVQEYTIRRGDNIWELCMDRFELPFWMLKKYNPEMNFSTLLPSEILMIPVVVKIEDID